jgi:hypothetical protein
VTTAARWVATGMASEPPGPSLRRFIQVLHAVLAASVVVSLILGNWLTAAITTAILGIALAPSMLGRRFSIYIPAEFELLAVLFIFASLFLGEVHSYYERFWWWDALLHLGSGFLLGILGFLLVYTINQRTLGNLGLRPSFLALFAFTFAVSLGTLWEIFEFTMDQAFGLNMQKSGLTDTMWDLIVDTFGALVISVLGWGYLRTTEVDSFLERWIEKYMRGNSLGDGEGDEHRADM